MRVATGSDTGGSLRNPAAFCNVVGFRPSIGRVPNPKALFGWSTLSTSGCLGRSVADLAFVLSAIAGPDTRAPLSIDQPGGLFARPLERSFKGVRVAWFKDLGGVPFDGRVRTIMDSHRATFESLGCIVEQAEPDFAPAEVSFRILRAWNSASVYGARLHEHPDAFKDTLKGEIEEGLRLTGADEVADDHKTRCYADARLKGRVGLQATHSSHQLQPRAHGSLCVVLVRLRITKVDQNPIAHVLRNETSEALHGLCDAFVVGRNDLA